MLVNLDPFHMFLWKEQILETTTYVSSPIFRLVHPFDGDPHISSPTSQFFSTKMDWVTQKVHELMSQSEKKSWKFISCLPDPSLKSPKCQRWSFCANNKKTRRFTPNAKLPQTLLCAGQFLSHRLKGCKTNQTKKHHPEIQKPRSDQWIIPLVE